MSATHGTTETCPDCDGRLNAGGRETVCRECGLVVDEDWLDRGPDWRSFDDEEGDGGRHTGAPITRSRHDKGLSTEIGHGSDTRLTGRKRRQVARMRREHNRARIATKSDRNQVYAFTEIRRLIGALSLPTSLRDRACTLFDRAQEEDLLRGRSIEGFAAAAVYAACRLASVSRTTGEVADKASADEDELTVAYTALNRGLSLPAGPIDPREYLPRFATALDLGTDVERRARELVGEAVEAGRVAGRNPAGVAAAGLYTAAKQCGADLTQADAAEVGDISPVTLRTTYYDLREESD